MALISLTSPAVEPISVTDVKTFLRFDNTHEDVLIGSLITTARLYVENKINRKLISQDCLLYLDKISKTRLLDIVVGPIQTVTQIQIYNANNSPTLIAPDSYELDLISYPARLFQKQADWAQETRKFNAIEITMRIGYGDNSTDVPEPIRQAMRILVAHWFERREPVILGSSAVHVPETVVSLLTPYMMVRL